MEKDSNKYNLEEFLRGHLEDYGAAENGWNMPPDELWKEVKPQIKAKAGTPSYKAFRKYLPLLAVIAFSVLIIILQINKSNEKIDRLTIEVSSLQQKLSAIQQPQDSVSGFSAGPINTKDQAAPTEQILKVRALQQLPQKTDPDPQSEFEKTEDYASNAKTVIPTAGDPGNTPDYPTNPSAPSIKGEMQTPGASDPENRLLPEGAGQLEKSGISTLAPLSSSLPSELEYERPPLSIDPLKVVKDRYKGSPAVKFSAGPLWITRTRDTVPGNFGRYEKHQHLDGLSAGLNLEWRFSAHWSLETGINYHRYGMTSEHKKHFHYSKEDENHPGLAPNEFQKNMRFHSPVGHVEPEMIFARESSGSSPHHRINMQADSRTRLHYVGIPVLLHYRITKGRLGVYLRGGFLGSLVVDQKFDLLGVKLNEEQVSFKRSPGTRKIEELKSFQLQYVLGAGLDYQFSPSYSLYVEPTFSRSLNPVAEVEGARIGLQTMGISGGIKLYF